ncbi:Metalloprotease [Trachipleistophora hominis]|uniref:Metalloprotease n=1 Tax=Trachipleistophora hominis TaxID=72359 RepID=L7JUX0_TRAHO|nr:Metalloprotease [Trachipleistophora hominis]
MKNHYSYAIYFVFTVTVIIIFIELLNALYFRFVLSEDMVGFRKGQMVYELAERNKTSFLSSQIKGSESRIMSVLVDIAKTVFLILVSLLFLNRKFQKFGMRIASGNISIVKRDFRNLTRKEINFICLIAGLFILNKLILQIVSKDKISKYFAIKISLMGIIGYLLVLPLAIFLAYVLLEYFGKKIIVACYLAYIIKILPDVLINDTVNPDKMEQVDVKSFPDDIQHLLYKYHLEDSVYKEKSPGSEKNAALIGYGKGARMEIYGNFTETDQDQLFSVFLHEIGHAKENTLMRKTIIYIALLIIELLFMLYIYDTISTKFTTEIISVFTAFVLLVFIYRALLRQWLLMIYKIASQQSEINSDMFAKQHDYGRELAETLFNIVIDANDFLKPTAVYNFLRSGHPAIYARIDYLGE